MGAVIHGLVTGLIWSAIFVTSWIAIAAVLTATVPASASVRVAAGESPRSCGAPPIPATVHLGRTTILDATRPRPRRSSHGPRPIRSTPVRVARTAAGAPSL
jgi:hypothetical protein